MSAPHPSLHTLLRVAVASCLLALAGCAGAPANPDPGLLAPTVFPAAPAVARYRFDRTIYGSKSVLELPSAGAVMRLLGKEDHGAGPGLSSPLAMAVDHGKVFVINQDESAVRVFDLPGRRFYSLGDNGPSAMQRPLGLSVDRAGRLYVADAFSNAIQVYDAQGKPLASVGGAKWFARLVGVTAEADGTRVYGLDAGVPGRGGRRVRVFDPRTGHHLFDLGEPGSGPGEFILPAGLALDKAGQIYVLDSGNYSVQIYDREGQYLRSFGSAGKPPARFGRPKAIAIDAEGNVNVVDAFFGGILVFSPTGAPQYAIGGRGEAAGAWQTLLPVGMAIDADGSLYCLDQGYRKIDVLRPIRRPGTGAR